jgi:hypothetical protein
MNKITNPFRQKDRKRMFDGVVRAYLAKHRDIGTPDKRHRGNSIAGYFWRGYDNVRPEQWDRESREMMAYVSYRAGQEVAKAKPE